MCMFFVFIFISRWKHGMRGLGGQTSWLWMSPVPNPPMAPCCAQIHTNMPCLHHPAEGWHKFTSSTCLPLHNLQMLVVVIAIRTFCSFLMKMVFVCGSPSLARVPLLKITFISILFVPRYFYIFPPKLACYLYCRTAASVMENFAGFFLTVFYNFMTERAVC